ncbi:MAG: PAS domain S-box protein [Spirochaetales bacterium]|nr:PAS domain S-box protein [Spirochaetales bacterium]
MHNLKLLVVDDDENFSNFMVSALNASGFQDVSIANSITETHKKVEENQPDLIFMDVTLEEAHSGIKLANTLLDSLQIPSIFVTGHIDNQTIARMEESNPYGLLFKPFSIANLKLVLNIALKKIALERARTVNEEKNKKNNEKLKNQLRELDAFFKIAQAIDKYDDPELFINETLEIIPKAFQLSEKISTRILYLGKTYDSPEFKESNWVLTENIQGQEDEKNIIELHLLDDNSSGNFPFSLEDIQTFSAITKQISNKLHKIELDSSLASQLVFDEMLNKLFQNIINISENSSTAFFYQFAKTMGSGLKANICQIHLKRSTIPKTQENRSLWKENETFEVFEFTEAAFSTYFSITQAMVIDFSRENAPLKGQLSNKNLNSGLLVMLPILNRGKNIGLILLYFQEIPSKAFLDILMFKMISDIMTLAISKYQREKKLLTYKQAIEQNPSSIVITDLKGNINYVNPRFSDVSGYSLQEVKGKNPRILKTGTQDKSFYKVLWNTISEGRIWKGTFHNRCKNGETIWELAVICPIKDGMGKSTGYIGIKEDISEKVKTEQQLKDLNTRLVTAQSSLVNEEKLASIGRLAAGIAHELNNPIGFINSNFRSLKSYVDKIHIMIKKIQTDYKDQDFSWEALIDRYQYNDIKKDIESIFNENQDGFDRVLNIINSLRDFSRIDKDKKRDFYDINHATRTTLVIANNELKYISDVVVHYGDIPQIWCASEEINQVILNLIVNAAQAIKENAAGKKSDITIETFNDSDFVFFSIKDSGPGIPDDIIDHVFEPFFTTKPIGMGTGLGLNISYDIIVNKHGGEIKAENAPEGGAVFTFKLPIEKIEED